MSLSLSPSWILLESYTSWATSILTEGDTNQVWSWDITYLATTIVGVFFRLYLVMDIYSRKIVSWSHS